VCVCCVCCVCCQLCVLCVLSVVCVVCVVCCVCLVLCVLCVLCVVLCVVCCVLCVVCVVCCVLFVLCVSCVVCVVHHITSRSLSSLSLLSLDSMSSWPSQIWEYPSIWSRGSQMSTTSPLQKRTNEFISDWTLRHHNIHIATLHRITSHRIHHFQYSNRSNKREHLSGSNWPLFDFRSTTKTPLPPPHPLSARPVNISVFGRTWHISYFSKQELPFSFLFWLRKRRALFADIPDSRTVARTLSLFRARIARSFPRSKGHGALFDGRRREGSGGYLQGNTEWVCFMSVELAGVVQWVCNTGTMGVFMKFQGLATSTTTTGAQPSPPNLPLVSAFRIWK
jgi:hypothetical protein